MFAIVALFLCHLLLAICRVASRKFTAIPTLEPSKLPREGLTLLGLNSLTDIK